MIDPKDYKKQTGIYIKKNDHSGELWRVIAYCEQPSITVENMSNGKRESFGIGGMNNHTFHRVEGLRFDHSTKSIIQDAAN